MGTYVQHEGEKMYLFILHNTWYPRDNNRREKMLTGGGAPPPSKLELVLVHCVGDRKVLVRADLASCHLHWVILVRTRL
jgi:hypothetical protein